MPRILLISGTSRPDNFTHRALAVVHDELQRTGAEIELLDARELQLNFPGHEESEDAEKLKASVGQATAILLATPEYHGSFCAMTKLIIENLGFPSALADKPVALIGVAAGRIGAIKSLEQLKGVLSHVGAVVVPGAVSIAGVQGVFDGDGNCTDPASEKALRGAASGLLEFLERFVCPAERLAELESAVRDGGAPWSSAI